MTDKEQAIAAILFNYKMSGIKTDQAIKEIQQAFEYHSKKSNDQEIIEFVEHLGIKGKFKDSEWFTTAELLKLFRERKQEKRLA